MFIEERLLDCVAYGSEFGREFNTRIVTLKNGVERRNAQWSAPLGRYSIVYAALEDADHQAVYNAHMACMGRLIGFRFKDWTDYEADQESVGTSTGGTQEMQLRKGYNFGPIVMWRKISKPVSVQLYADGSPIASATDMTTGLVTFTASDGAEITWSGEFDVPVRFDEDRLDLEPVAPGSGGFLLSTDVSLSELRL